MSRANRIARLVAIQQGTEFVLLKHRQGKHDQATHGSWDTDRSNNKKSDFKYGVQDAIDKVIKGEVGKVVPADAGFWLDKMADREDNPDLTNLEIVGTKLFTRDNLGIMRDKMPQVPSAQKDEFLNEMAKRGIGVSRENISPQELHPIQAEISASKSGKIMRDVEKNGHEKGDKGRIVVSSDNYVIDGHHRWAASAFLSFKDKKESIPVLRVDMTHMELIDVVLAWNKASGIKSIALGESNKPLEKAWVEFELAVIKGILTTEMRKHQAGQHDQSSHGARYFHGSNTDLQIGDYLRPPSETGKSPRSHPDIDPREFNNADYVYLTSSESQAFGYARDLNEGKNYVYEVESIDDDYLEIDPEVDYGFADVGSFRINKPVKIIGKKEIVAKHLSGQHDQSSHGSWATGKDAITLQEKFEFTDEDGVKTSVDFQDFLTEEEQKDFLSIVKDLKKTTDLSGWDEVNIVLSDNSRRYSNFTALGETTSYFEDTSYRENGTYVENGKFVSDIYLKPESFQKKEPDFFDKTSWMKRSMEGKVTSVGEYLLAHEWGHVVDFARIFINSTPDIKSRDEAKSKGEARKETFFASAEKDLSWYGKTSLSEFYAEAYADWFMNDGKDSYPWMEKMALEEKWKK